MSPGGGWAQPLAKSSSSEMLPRLFGGDSQLSRLCLERPVDKHACTAPEIVIQWLVIVGFADAATEDLFNEVSSTRARVLKAIERPARRKLHAMAVAVTLDDLRVPPGNRLEALKGDLAGYHSIRINDQWRIVFRWKDGAAHEVRIVDYH